MKSLPTLVLALASCWTCLKSEDLVLEINALLRLLEDIEYAERPTASSPGDGRGLSIDCETTSAQTLEMVSFALS